MAEQQVGAHLFLPSLVQVLLCGLASICLILVIFCFPATAVAQLPMADHTRVVVVTEALGAERTSANVFGPVANATLLGGAILWTSLGDLSRVRMRHSWATPLGQVVGEVRRISCVLHDLRSLRSVSAASSALTTIIT